MAVVYHTHYGSTKQYAEWLAEELSGDLYDGRRVSLAGLADYKTLDIGGPLYAGVMLGLRNFTRHFQSLRALNLILRRKNPEELRSEDQEMLATYGKVVDFKGRSTLAPIISQIRKLLVGKEEGT